MNTTYKGYNIVRLRFKKYGESNKPALVIQVRQHKGDRFTILKSIVLQGQSMNTISRAMKKCYRYIDSLVENGR